MYLAFRIENTEHRRQLCWCLTVLITNALCTPTQSKQASRTELSIKYQITYQSIHPTAINYLNTHTRSKTMTMKILLQSWLLITAIASSSATHLRRNAIANQLHHRVLQLQEDTEGTFLSKHIQYEEDVIEGMSMSKKTNKKGRGSRNRPHETYNIEMDDNLIYTITNVNKHWLDTKAKELRSGLDRIKIRRGAIMTRDNAEIDLQGRSPRVVSDRGGTMFHRGLGDEPPKELANGNRTVLAVKIITTEDGESYSFSEDYLSKRVFGDNMTLVSRYRDCSYGRMIFTKPADFRLRNGVVTVEVKSKAEKASDIRNLVTTELKDQFNVNDITDLADHLMYCMPAKAMDGTIAYAYLGGW